MSFLLRFQDIPQYHKHNLVNLLFHSKLFTSIYDPKTECPNEFDLRNYIQKFLDDMNSHHPLYSKCILNKDYSVECFTFCMSVSNIKKMFRDVLISPQYQEFLRTLVSDDKSDYSFLILGYKSENLVNEATLQLCLNETIKGLLKDYKLSDISVFSTLDNNNDINSIYKSFCYTFKNILTSIHLVEDNFRKILLPKSPKTVIITKENEEKKNDEEMRNNYYKNSIINPFQSQKPHIKLEWCTSKEMPIELANSDNPFEIIKNKSKSEKEKENFIEEMKGIELIKDAFLTDPCLFFMISGYINKPERINSSDYSEETIKLVEKCIKPMLQGGIESYASHGCCLFAKNKENNDELVGGLAFSIFDSRESIDQYEFRRFTNLSNGILRNKNVNYMTLLRGISIEYHYKFIRESFVGKNSEYIYVHILAIFSNAQGKGYGSELMNSIIRYSEIFHLKIVLETHKYENVLFYQKFGFVLKNEDEGYYFYKLPKAYLLIREPSE